ncbi:Rv3235 family protein [Nocardia halotolerans]|uniref:Rv3235 family protein n=1 Tax=Nocardia halotolerans TaxID=1755878 RepID=A0ABV8VMD4_9NOCA
MSTDRTSLSPAPHCEPQLENRVTGHRYSAEPLAPHRITSPARRRTTHGTPAGIRRAVRSACVRGAPPAAEPETDAMRFAEQVLRLVLEVIDRRRQVGQLRALIDPLVGSVLVTMLARNLAPGRSLGTASLTRVRQTASQPGAAEIFASYQRGDRTFAIAGRIESVKGTWRLVALRLY